MNRVSKGFTTFITSVLKILLIIAIAVSSGTIYKAVNGFNISIIFLVGIVGIALFLGYKIINSDIKKKIWFILFIAFIVRLLWILNVDSVPNSDFKTIYNCAEKLLNGDTSMFWGTGYIARFPHLTVMVLYMAFMRWAFPVNNLIAMKGANLIFGVLVVYLLYLIIRELFKNEKYGLYGALGATIFPPLVTYTATFCTENIAIPFYLLSIYLFLLGIKKNRNLALFIGCGICLSIGNLFRMVALVVIVAYSMYILIYTNTGILEKIKGIVSIVLPYYMILWLVSGTLQATKITEFPLWKGSEPSITNVLKGTHYESGGRWNPEDAALPEECNYDYELIEERSKEIIKERLTTTSPTKLAKFYLKKFALQWNEGDLSGVFWSHLDAKSIKVNISGSGTGVLQFIYVCILVLVLIGTFNRRENDKKPEINLIYLILCGYGATYLITESQGRYSYIACWVFVILAISGFDYIKNRYLPNRKDA